MSLELEYFYGGEEQRYSFYRFPKTLFTDRRCRSVSMEARVLYGLMLDRVELSVRNGWLDGEGRVYIYFTLNDAAAILGCGKDKAVRLFRELSGIGLIERRKQGQGKPARVYVRQFTSEQDSDDSQTALPPAQPSEIPQSGLRDAPALRTSEKPQSALPESSGPDFGKSAANKTDKNYTESSDTDLSIHPPAPLSRSRRPSPQDSRDRMDEMDFCRAMICENIGYEYLLREHSMDADLIDCYVELMVEACCSRRDTVRVNQEDIPTPLVRDRFLKLDQEHILYVMDALKQNTSRVGNIRAYTLSALYNAPVTIGQYYTSQVSHDLAHWREDA